MAQIPIWKDTYYTSTADTLQYTIKDSNSGEVIFSGKAYKFPDGDNLKINISSICADYLNTDIPAIFWTTTRPGQWWFTLTDGVKTFTVNDEEDNLLSSYTFVNDYLYRDDNSDSFSFPVNDKWAPNMYKLTTIRNNLGYIMLGYSFTPTGVTEACGDYALYYQNMRMGWDSLLIEGNVVRTDDFSFNEYTREYNNTTNERGNVRYLNQIQPRWSLSTGWLNEAQAAIVAEHLLSSNSVWLHNLKTGEIIPVSITDSNAEYKKYLGKKQKRRICYTINVKATNKKLKRL